MSIELFLPMQSLNEIGCPKDVIDNAKKTSRRVAKIVWDEEDVPDHCKGYVQWSVRPYRVTDGCDGTRDSNAMFVCHEFCKATGLDIVQVYTAAYSDEENIFDDSYFKHLEDQRETTELPEVNQENMIHLLKSLYDMNWRSFVGELSKQWSSKGYKLE